jgi:hypothetical protein
LRVVILPSLTANQILNGNRADEFPPEYRGGIGEAGARWMDRFVREGGTLVALKDSSALPIRIFRMPIRDSLESLPAARRPTIPGAILRIDLDTKHPIAAGLRSDLPAMFDGGMAFEPDLAADRDQTLKPVTVAKWGPASSLRIAGFAEGLDLVAERGALVQCAIGHGQVVLFGFSPQFRAQTWATFPLLENAIRSGLEKN